ncbi:hypothetical protein IB341_004979 [Escherichia coli]|nr:hypothetical protein [Escherichia coli]
MSAQWQQEGRTDIYGYYWRIRKGQVIHQYINYSVEDDGEPSPPPTHFQVFPGALSLFLGISFLWFVDGGFERGYWLVRRAITRLYVYFDDTEFTYHPSKTMVGRVENGFDLLGSRREII